MTTTRLTGCEPDNVLLGKKLHCLLLVCGEYHEAIYNGYIPPSKESHRIYRDTSLMFAGDLDNNFITHNIILIKIIKQSIQRDQKLKGQVHK